MLASPACFDDRVLRGCWLGTVLAQHPWRKRKRELQESYFVGWLLGIPLAVLVLVWLFFR